MGLLIRKIEKAGPGLGFVLFKDLVTRVQKLLKRPVTVERKVALFWLPATGAGGGSLSKLAACP